MTMRERTDHSEQAQRGGAGARWLGAFRAPQQRGGVELLLPYRDEFASAEREPAIERWVIAALADLAISEAAAQQSGLSGALQSLRIEHLASAGVGQQLRARAQLVGQSAIVQIVTNDDQALIARAWGSFAPAAAQAHWPAPGGQATQPVYPN